MAQIFHPSTNAVFRVGIAGAIVVAAALLLFVDTANRSPWVSRVGIPRQQPVPFSHKLHAGGLGIDCRHCHASVEQAAFAGMPSTKTCMNCHSQIFSSAAVLEPVRVGYRDDRSIEWVRVADLPDFVYFDHSIHVWKGFGCVTCHGRVDQMPLVWNTASFQMAWCLDCHRHPDRYVRPREQVFSMTWEPEEDQSVLASRLIKQYRIRRATDCSVCHR